MDDSFRLKKAQAIRSAGGQPYASSFERTHTLAEVKDLKEKKPCRVAGRVMLCRSMGKMTFLTLQDHTGRLQIALKEDITGSDAYKKALALLDLGDFVGITGERFTTQRGEPTVMTKEWTMLTKALRQPPEKWQGIKDQETAWRQRYLDLLSNRETFERFAFRSLFVRKLREYYWKNDFTEVETPVLVNAASGALAEPFGTHHNAYDLDMFLRIAPETFLKECLVGGFDRVFEVARCFRNEGLDPSHLQDFTMVEHYAAYWDFEMNMQFTEKMFSALIKNLLGTTKVKIPDREGKLVTVDFKAPWPRLTMRDAILKNCGIDIAKEESADRLRAAMKKKNIQLDVPVEKLGRGNLIDQLYKKVSRPLVVQPTFITSHPIDLSPLARRNDTDPSITDRFQLVVGGWEIVNAYSELTDPVDQAGRFEQQAKASAGGDKDAHRKDTEFVKALEYGCPPASGWGMGVDRIVALLTQQTNLRDVVLFPLMKPEKSSDDSVSPAASAPPLRELPSGNTDGMLLQHAEYGHLLPEAHRLLEAHTDQIKAHLLATGAAMEALAKKFGGDPATWKIAGLLHDLDWDKLAKNYEEHCGETLEHMLASVKIPQEVLADIRAHYAEKYGAQYPLDSMLRKCLYCVDELTGFIVAVALVRPSKKLFDMEVKSVMKKLKDKAFAAAVSREQIGKCEELLNIPLADFIQLTLDAMKGIADEIGL
ncbi:MAG: lysine--tRNA ligase [Candidatus Peribacteraceae bacterium]|nr:lysine--tRNA ligase [Candidatus Peribacteraceae bacterium]MDD5074927.1 lysine--tRNA ligase [Candidatus Peribacteraceae bacterium]